MAVPTATTSAPTPSSTGSAPAVQPVDPNNPPKPAAPTTGTGVAAPGDKFVKADNAETNDTGKEEEAKGAMASVKAILSRIHLLITSTVRIVNSMARFAIFGTVVGLSRQGVDLLQGLLGSGDFKNSALKGNLTGLLSLINTVLGSAKDSASFWQDDIKIVRDLKKGFDDNSKLA
jgi:hypothetical protein